jgi:hypothetical protein
MTTPEYTHAHARRYLLMRPVGAGSIVSSILIVVAAACALGIAWSMWNGYFLAQRFIDDDTAVSLSDLEAADSLTSDLNWVYLGALLVAGIAFIIWLYRVRWNAEILCDAEHRRSRGWMTGSWFCPFVNLWFPFQVVSDIWKASKPDTPRQLDRLGLDLVSGSGLLAMWWGCWLSSFVIDRVVIGIGLSGEMTTLADVRTVAILETVSVVMIATSGGLLIMAMRQIVGWQQQARTETQSD